MYLLHTCAANAKTHILGGKMYIFESLNAGWIICLGLSVAFGRLSPNPPCLHHWIIIRFCDSIAK